MDKQELDMALFMQLVMSLQSTAWIMLGKVADPFTGQTEPNLDAAKATIDTLLMLKEKTEGNLSIKEKEYLDTALSDLQLNFVSESQKPQKLSADQSKRLDMPAEGEPSESSTPGKSSSDGDVKEEGKE